MGAQCAHHLDCDDNTKEPDTNTDPKTVATVQSKIDRCLYWSGGLPFEKQEAVMTNGSLKTVENLTAILKRYPALGLKVLGFTGDLPEAEALRLSHMRTVAVKNALQEAGCPNLVAAKGMGFADNAGQRIELTLCEPHEVSSFMAEVQDVERRLKLLAAAARAPAAAAAARTAAASSDPGPAAAAGRERGRRPKSALEEAARDGQRRSRPMINRGSTGAGEAV
eukprot:CAMPEP_0168438064 /NCGR_PEP_ID=MMETSP0228-20121227/41768_1 /TAXON_ID=133427 /ORGANISM="Protoceratium reticulatum, Strain CCCM 535 (=CCMP 1889)" /LENGTH=222 /DNA_ID=CAMNT_0008452319 /DNA_START=60 /DNA_END=726 /DNA_ORIENTATION=+